MIARRSLRARLATLARYTAVLTLVFWLGVFSVSRIERVFTPGAPAYAQAFATALCARDATYIAGHIGGRIQVTESQLRNYFDGLAACAGIRFIAADPSPSGSATRFVFILTEGDHDVPYLLTFDSEGRVVDIK